MTTSWSKYVSHKQRPACCATEGEADPVMGRSSFKSQYY